jgi:hypothetical protein
MAQKTIITVTCDLEHLAETPASRTQEFSFDGDDFEVDTCEQHGEELAKAFGGYLAVARPATSVRRRPRAGIAAARRARTGPSQTARDNIRAWSKTPGGRKSLTAAGLKVAERGRISGDAVALFQRLASQQPNI